MAKNIFATKEDVDKLLKMHGGVFKRNQGLTVTGLNKEQTLAYALGAMHNESDGRQRAENSKGYVGLFQFGAAALTDAGLIKMDKYKAYLGANVSQKSFLNNKDNWTIAGGLETFLDDRDLQYKIFIKNSNRNIRAGESEYKNYVKNPEGKSVLDSVFPPILNANSTAIERAGFAMGAHLKGATGANKYFHLGNNSRDGNRVEISSYVERGKRSVNDLSSIAAQFLSSSSLANSESKLEDVIAVSKDDTIPIVPNAQLENYIPPLITKDIEKEYEGYKWAKGKGRLKDGTPTIDCSHLVNEILKRYGYKIPYQTTAELKSSKFFDEIDVKDVKPGDIALWDGHTGIVEEPINADEKIGKFYGSQTSTGPSSTYFGPNTGYWEKPKSYLRPRAEYLNPTSQKNTAVEQKKVTPPKVPPSLGAVKSNTNVAKEKRPSSGYELLNSMMSALKQLPVPNLEHASKTLLSQQPEDYLSAKGCCCASGKPGAASTVINQNTSITLNAECKDPHALGKIVTNAQEQVNRDMMRKITPRTS
ncbi:hypothetical protein Z042_17835 [Chania multitudinisentens RB-25]|uniref:NlpC/P60 domain-containing protein n=1 Tax=Chania multitudinisentens RB-25 TaxID=1441930 RepID=W0LLL0_9GAMM|nr:hypothetical protein [Chania multitudinisentens]AHG22900.1 hypothetical protein Z042_17835 [Chania multitudinisentens RB-25]